eukprot:IDg640t1
MRIPRSQPNSFVEKSDTAGDEGSVYGNVLGGAVDRRSAVLGAMKAGRAVFEGSAAHSGCVG